MEKNKLKFFGLPVVLPYLKPYKKEAASLIGFAVLGGICEIIFPLFQQYAINNFIYSGSENISKIVYFALIYLATLILYVFVNIRSTFASCQVEMYTSRDLRKAAFAHLQTLSSSFYNKYSVGHIHARLHSDTEKISIILSWIAIDIMWCVTYTIGALAAMLLLNFKLALWVAAILPVAVGVSIYFRKKLTECFHKVREANSVVTSKLNEGIIGAKEAKSMVAEKLLQERFEDSSKAMERISVKMVKWRSLYVSLFSLASSVALALVLWRGGIITAEGVIIVGTLSAFLTYVVELVDRLNSLVNTITRLINTHVNIERYHTLMNTFTEVNDSKEVMEKYGDIFSPKKENWEEIQGEIEFENVTFTYPDGNEKVLENFSLKIPKGTNCAIVGQTGAGKSTLVNLVCRFFEPTDGRVLIDGKDVKDRSLSWLHSNIGYVLQTPHLFTGTIRENLIYGNENATQEQIEKAVNMVSAQSIIERMGGYDANVGEGGDLLSTGEKQLLSFARALIADPKIFILDEATSSIDTLTEQKLQNAIEEAMKGRTSLVIAHRLSTIRQADIILVVKDGKITERGTHTELIKKKGYYYELYLKQFRDEATANLYK